MQIVNHNFFFFEAQRSFFHNCRERDRDRKKKSCNNIDVYYRRAIILSDRWDLEEQQEHTKKETKTE